MLLVVPLLLAATAAAAPSASELAPIHGPYAPKIDPANFVRLVRPGQGPQRLVHGRELARAEGRPLREGERLVEVRRERRQAALEPQTEKKYYVKGVGEVKEQVVKGHHEQFELVTVTHPSQR
jgi:hypothetical protein